MHFSVHSVCCIYELKSSIKLFVLLLLLHRESLGKAITSCGDFKIQRYILEVLLKTARQLDSGRIDSIEITASDLLSKFCGSGGLQTAMSRKLQSFLKQALKFPRNTVECEQVLFLPHFDVFDVIHH